MPVDHTEVEKIVQEIAEGDWWTDDFHDGPLYCFFCNVYGDDVRDGKADHEPDCLWARSIALVEKAKASV